MFKPLNGIRLVRFEPEYHTAIIYKWYYSGDYEEFYRYWPNCPSAQDLVSAAIDKTFMIINLELNEVVGCVNIYDQNDISRNFYVGMLVDKRFENKSVGKNALKIFLNWKFNFCNYYKAKASIMSRNKRVQAFILGLGFYHESCFKKDVFLDGEFHDVAVYAIFKNDFNKKCKKEFEHYEARLEAPIEESKNELLIR